MPRASIASYCFEKKIKSYKDEYVKGMTRLREDCGIGVIATGDMDLVGTMTRNWIEECGEEAGIEALLPLWKADRVECLETLWKERFTIIFSSLKSLFYSQ
jgi:diphthamide synthase (EF-2-diphthine--ammonia ligase)